MLRYDAHNSVLIIKSSQKTTDNGHTTEQSDSQSVCSDHGESLYGNLNLLKVIFPKVFRS